MVSDHRGFTDDDARAVIDEEVFPDLRAGVDVDSGVAVGILRHDAGNKGDAQAVEFVGHAVDEDGEHPRIAEYDLLPALRRGIALKLRLHILEDVYKRQQLLGEVYAFPTTCFLDSDGVLVGEPIPGVPSLENAADAYYTLIQSALAMLEG